MQNDKKLLKAKCTGYYKTIIKIINKSLKARQANQTIEIINNIKTNGPGAYVEYYLNKVIPSLHSEYEDLWAIKTDKKFAYAVKDITLNSVMFARRKGKIKGFGELGKIVGPNKILDHMMREYPEEFKQLMKRLDRREFNNGK